VLLVGVMMYGPHDVEFEDRLLTHLEIVIVNKFRRGESFLLSWLDDVSVGGGRSSLWMAAEVPVYFTYRSSQLPAIDKDWLHALELGATSARGLIVVDEAGNLARAGSAGHKRQDRPTGPGRVA
jgi:hypothetical protein